MISWLGMLFWVWDIKCNFMEEFFNPTNKSVADVWVLSVVFRGALYGFQMGHSQLPPEISLAVSWTFGQHWKSTKNIKLFSAPDIKAKKDVWYLVVITFISFPQERIDFCVKRSAFLTEQAAWQMTVLIIKDFFSKMWEWAGDSPPLQKGK